MDKPSIKPQNPNFSSGPCAKRPGWSYDALSDRFLGRSHRAVEPKALIKTVIDKQKSLLGIPDDYLVGIVPASDTGAFEMAIWSMLGARGVDVFAWEAFSSTWLKDITNELKLDDVHTYEAAYGALPDLSLASPDRDTVFVWNGTTSGVRVPNGEWIAADRKGLSFCDATSAVFAYDLPWDKLDVTTWSWQKVLGGEAAHGMIVLSPRAVERLESFTPDRPLPKIFRMTKKGKINAEIFTGSTINTPSMMAIEDCMDALNWVERIGGLSETIKRCNDNTNVIREWVNRTGWVAFLPEHEDIASVTSVCLLITDPWFKSTDETKQGQIIKELCTRLETEKAGYDIKSYRDAPAGLRVWCGATVEATDVAALLPWIEWAYTSVKSEAAKAAA